MPNRSADGLNEAPIPKRRGRALGWTLWPALMIYCALVVWRAYGELNAGDTVHGLFRTWHPPQTLAVGQLFDARIGELHAEIDTRFTTQGPRPTDDSMPAWQAALRARGFRVTQATGPGEGDSRIVFMPNGPWLIVSRAHARFVTFDPQRGMILMHEGVIAPETPALRFERPAL